MEWGTSHRIGGKEDFDRFRHCVFSFLLISFICIFPFSRKKFQCAIYSSLEPIFYKYFCYCFCIIMGNYLTLYFISLVQLSSAKTFWFGRSSSTTTYTTVGSLPKRSVTDCTLCAFCRSFEVLSFREEFY